MTAQPLVAEHSSPLRRRIIAEAARVTARSGWSSVTMGALAQSVGVSRQTVYNEIGSKPALAEAMVLDELAAFLLAVEAAFDEHPVDHVQAIRAAVLRVLQLAQGNALLRAIVSDSYGADAELLPLLTTRANSVLASARAVLSDRLASPGYHLPEERRVTSVDAIVRVVLSHVTQPTATPEATSEDVAWMAGRLLTRSP